MQKARINSPQVLVPAKRKVMSANVAWKRVSELQRRNAGS
jgi:hypothetical protein